MDTKETAFDRAQRRANHEGAKFEVWEHVGDYGNPRGDIPARHTFRVLPFGAEPGEGWAMIGIAEPESTKTVLHYKPIPSASSTGNGITALTIYPPGAWMESPNYHVFVGGSGVGVASSLVLAEELLLQRAKQYAGRRIDEAKVTAAHYAAELSRLSAKGLERLKD